MSHRSRILCTLLKEFLIIDISSLLYRQVEELQAQVGQLSARCQEQQQDLDLLKVFFTSWAWTYAIEWVCQMQLFCLSMMMMMLTFEIIRISGSTYGKIRGVGARKGSASADNSRSQSSAPAGCYFYTYCLKVSAGSHLLLVKEPCVSISCRL